jgi:Flp pilus assembly protein TadG
MKTLAHALMILRRLHRNQQGVAYLEFALALPMLVMMFMGAVEVTRFVIMTEKVEKVAIAVSDLTAQSSTATNTGMSDIVKAAEQIMLPYTFGSGGYVIVSSITKTGTAAPKVNWQYKGGGTMNKNSLVGSAGSAASLPTGFTMADKENVIITEVFYNYTPLFSGRILKSKLIYKTSFYKPRLGALTTLTSLSHWLVQQGRLS